MGVWANGPDPRGDRVDVAGIAEMMRPALYGFFTAHIQVWDPGRHLGNALTLVLDSGPEGALVQPLRTPYGITLGEQPNSVYSIRFQVKREAVAEPDTVLRGGLVVKVIDGGNADGLERYVFSIPETIDSSLAWGRIWEASVTPGGI